MELMHSVKRSVVAKLFTPLTHLFEIDALFAYSRQMMHAFAGGIHMPSRKR